jgi:acyl carrier protein phosphodiesterase
MASIDESHSEFMEDILRDAHSMGQPLQECFFERYAVLAAGNGDCCDLTYTPVKKEGATGYQIDGYALNTEQGDLYLAIADFRDEDELQTLNQQQIDTYFGRSERFYKQALKPEFINALEDTSPAFEAAYPIFAKNINIKRVRVIIFSNARIVSRKKSVEAKQIDGKKFIYNIMDFSRYNDIISSMGETEPIEINLAEEFNSTLPCLRAHTGSGDYKSYLIVMPGELLSRIYELYGARLLEQNVRTFLQAKTKVNQGIITTLEKSPEMFFAYNNGLTATASGVEVSSESAGSTSIRAIRNLQIVNGGQTTASILYAKDNKSVDLANVFVQMKLTVLPEERVEEVVPRISKFANSQNKISDADFFSTHPFHIEMEKVSRRLSAPQKEGAFTSTKWFYERARGQYRNQLAKGKSSDRKKFEMEFPKDQIIEKTDLAKYVLTFERLPHQVSKGAQKCFMEFADRIGKEWENRPDSFNEGYFKDAIAMAIIFRWTDQMIAKSDWYRDDRGYKAQIVTYSIALLVHILDRADGKRISLQQVWNRQAPGDALMKMLEKISVQVATRIKDAPPNVKNIGEYCKQQACWSAVSGLDFVVPEMLLKELVDKDDIQQQKRDNVAIKKIDKGIEFDEKLLKLNSYVPELRKFAESMKILSPAADAALTKIARGNISLNFAEKNAVVVILKNMDDAGYEMKI